MIKIRFDFVACVSSVFGHISYRSDWELVKVDFRQSFPRQCAESDYDSWQLTDLQVTHIHARRVYTCNRCARLSFKLNPGSFPRERSALWVRTGVSGRGRTLHFVSREKVTPQLSAANRVSAMRETLPGENTHIFHCVTYNVGNTQFKCKQWDLTFDDINPCAVLSSSTVMWKIFEQ